MSAFFQKLLGVAPKPHENDVILTGVPRSGTTLTCFLLNKSPNVVALHEPMDDAKFALMRDDEERCDAITAFYAQTRAALRKNGVAHCRQVEGRVPDNPIGQARTEAGLRMSQVEWGEIKIDKPLAPDFVLGLKHPASFTALLEPLCQRYSTFAVVRNPLASLSSWNSIKMPIYQGHIQAAEGIDSQLKSDLAAIPDRVDRQLHILNWFFAHYAQFLPPDRVIRYENIIESGGKALHIIAPAAANLEEPLQSRNQSANYDRATMKELGQRLLDSDGAYWQFYQRRDVEILLEQLDQTP